MPSSTLSLTHSLTSTGMMQDQATESTQAKMESLRLICETQVPIELQKVDSFSASFCKSLDSIKAQAEETIETRGKVAELKLRFREAEHDFVKALAVKTRKEARQMAISDSISAARARIEELKRTVQVQRARRDEYAMIMSQQSQVFATYGDNRNQDIEQKEEIKEAMLWYNTVLGFQIEAGPGVKFTFNKINMKNPHEEYSLTVRLENDTYTLLACDPHLDDTKMLILELNKTNDLFKFVRTMRQKFQEAASLGCLPQSTTLCQESSTISLSAPVRSVSTERSESPVKRNDYSHEEVKRHTKKVNLRSGARHTLPSPPSVRRSPRFVRPAKGEKK